MRIGVRKGQKECHCIKQLDQMSKSWLDGSNSCSVGEKTQGETKQYRLNL